MNARSREAANNLARRAIAAAERRRAAEAAGDDVAERLRAAADEDGRLTPDAALAALGEQERRPWNPFTDPDHLEREAAKQRAARKLVFREPDNDNERTE